MISEELRAKIVLVSESMEGLDDIETVRVSAKFMCAVFDAIDALQAKLDAVPVWAIALLRTEATDEAWEAWAREEGGESSEALSVVDAWLKRVQP